MHKRSSIFWGVALVVLAVLLLLLELGKLDGNVWDYFWPIALILVGTWMLIGYFLRSKPQPYENVTHDLGSARSVAIKIDHGAGKLHIHDGTPTGSVLSGLCRGGVDMKSETSGDRLDIKLRSPSQFWEWAPGTGLDWDLALSRDVPMKLTIHSGASALVLNLTELIITELKIDTGASSAEIALPAHAGNVIADIDTGVSSVKVKIPKDVAARIRAKTGISALQIDKNRFPQTGGEMYQSPDYATATNRIDLTIDSGVGTIEIN